MKETKTKKFNKKKLKVNILEQNNVHKKLKHFERSKDRSGSKEVKENVKIHKIMKSKK